MGWGVFIEYERTGEKIGSFTGFQPAATQNSNNVAEYLAFKLALDQLETLYKVTGSYTFTIVGDSQLVVKQMRGEWIARTGRYIPTYTICAETLIKLRAIGLIIDIEWIPRAQNSKADFLSKAQFKSRNISIKNYGKG